MSDYLGALGLRFVGPAGDGYSNVTRDFRDEWTALVRRAEAAGVTISIPPAEAKHTVPTQDQIAQVVRPLLGALENYGAERVANVIAADVVQLIRLSPEQRASALGGSDD